MYAVDHFGSSLLELILVYQPAFCDFARPPNPVESVLALPTDVIDYILQIEWTPDLEIKEWRCEVRL